MDVRPNYSMLALGWGLDLWGLDSWGLDKLLLGVVAAYVFVCFLMWLLEDVLVYPRWSMPHGDWNPPNLDFERVDFASADGTRLHGWYFTAPNPRGYIVFFHGNGQTISLLGDFAQQTRDKHRFNVLVFDYRGYGKSDGKPSERGVLSDGIAAVRWMMEREKIPASEIILWGRSLGGAVAVEAAVELGAKGLIAERTFATMPEAAAHRYGWLPVKWLMRNRYPTVEKIGRYEGPFLQSHGDRDEIVPLASGRKLFAACTSPNKEFVEIPGLGHNGPNPPEFIQRRAEFLESLASSS